MVRKWYETGAGVVREWYRSSTKVVREWYESGRGVVRELSERGAGAVRELVEIDTGVVGAWWESGTIPTPCPLFPRSRAPLGNMFQQLRWDREAALGPRGAPRDSPELARANAGALFAQSALDR